MTPRRHLGFMMGFPISPKSVDALGSTGCRSWSKSDSTWPFYFGAHSSVWADHCWSLWSGAKYTYYVMTPSRTIGVRLVQEGKRV